MVAAPVVSLRGVSKIYGSGEVRVEALKDINVDFERGKFTAIMGPSGSGKSTLLQVLAGLDTASGGSVVIAGNDITKLSDSRLTRLRREKIGYVFQSYNLVPTLDARANILLPENLAGRAVDPEWFERVIFALGLQDRLSHLPSEMSGGQQQRVAVARALAMRPHVIVADEPTGNLDSHSSGEVLGLLRAAVDNLDQSVIMVTHDAGAASIADRVLVVRDGKIVADLTGATLEEVEAVSR